jgi:peptidyl-prolyl cis-trans isomerase C
MIGSAWRRHPMRLRAIVVCTLLLAANAWATESPDADPVLAVVNGYDIRLSYVYAQIEAMPLGDQVSIRQQLERFIESIVREEVLFQSMLASNFSSEPELRDEIKAVVVKHLIDRYVTERVAISQHDVQKYFQDNASAIRGENVRASEIRLAQKEDCESLMASIDSQQAFEAAARERSMDRRSGERGGDIGLFMNHEGPFGFEAALFEMQKGDMRVFQSAEGCHLVRVTERVTPPLPPLEEVAPRIREILRTQQERALLGELLERGEKGLDVERMKLDQN